MASYELSCPACGRLLAADQLGSHDTDCARALNACECTYADPHLCTSCRSLVGAHLRGPRG